jgi:transketolase
MISATNSNEFATRIRELALKMVHRAKSSHIGGALSMADIIAVLYTDILKTDPSDPSLPTRDRLILSKGHACTALYAALALKGFFPVEELATYGQNNSRLMAHISHKIPGVEFSTGSLGHGLPFGLGKALAAQRRKLSWRTFVIISDGELNEGSNWEAILLAPHHRLGNLRLIVDYNKIQSFGAVEDVISLDNLAEKFHAFRWQVHEIDGHNHDQLRTALQTPATGAPQVVIAHTVKGKGVSFMENQLLWHYRNPDDIQLQKALVELGIITITKQNGGTH